MKIYVRFLLSVFLFVLPACNHASMLQTGFIMNAKIWTGDSANPEATAIAIKDSLILYVGNDYQPYAAARQPRRSAG